MGETLLQVRDLRVAFDNGRRHEQVLHGIDLHVAPGEALGMVGESGCGKSVTWLAILKLLGAKARIQGHIDLRGQQIDDAPESVMTQVRGKKIAMIFQDPSSSLNPVHRIGYQLTESIRLHQRLSADAARHEAVRLLDRVRIANAKGRIDAYPHELSGGMNQRVMIAMALSGKPDLLIADEPTTALDVTIQAQILDLLAQIRRETGSALVLVSHDLGVVAQVCDRVMVLYAGRVVESASTDKLFANPCHPYTKGLLDSLPDALGPRRRLVAIPGNVPQPGQLPPGCAFAERCTRAAPICERDQPSLSLRKPAAEPGPPLVDHRVACHADAHDVRHLPWAADKAQPARALSA